LRRRAARDMMRILERAGQRLDGAARRLLTPAERLARNRERVALAARSLRRAASLREHRQRVDALRTALGHLDPTQVLARGYSIVRDAAGHVRATSAGLAKGDALDIMFSQGGAAVTVDKPR